MDYDGDGDVDLITGSDDCCDTDYEFFLFRRGDDGRIGSRESIRMRYNRRFSVTMRTRVCVSDWNRDGKLDLIFQHNEVPGLLVGFGPWADREAIALSHRIEGSEPVRVISTRPNVVDWDNDGLPDVLVGMKEHKGPWGVYLLCGVDDETGAQLTTPKRLIAPPKRATITGLDVADWDGDGVFDLILGVTRSKRSQVWVYRRVASDQ